MPSISYSCRLEELERDKPDEVHLIIEDQAYTRKTLNQRANQMARLFAQEGVGQADTVTICTHNNFEYFVACLASWKLGAIPNPLSSSLPVNERRAIIAEACPALIYGLEDTLEDDVDAIPSLPLGFDLCAGFSVEPLPDAIAPHERALASGGSTGRPKLIVPANSASYDPQNPAAFFKTERAVLVTGPTCHALPYCAAWYALLGGQLAVVMDKFDPERCLRLIERHAVDRIYFVPTMMQRIWRLPESVRNQYNLSSLSAVLSGGAPCPQWLMKAWIDWIGASRMFEGYAPSERIGRTFIDGHQWLQHPGSVGLPQDGCQIRILDDSGKELPSGEVGEIYMMPAGGAGSSFHYRGADRQVSEGGWETVGDMGYLDQDGYLYISDRRADMIIAGGRNIFPAEVEAALERYPAVESSAVIGLDNEDMGETVHAIIYAPGGVSLQSIDEYMSEQLVSYKCPSSYEFIDHSLRSDTGKMRRSALRAARNQKISGM